MLQRREKRTLAGQCGYRYSWAQQMEKLGISGVSSLSFLFLFLGALDAGAASICGGFARPPVGALRFISERDGPVGRN